MKLISLTQPWASLVFRGIKRIETRSWETSYRGWLAIHTTRGPIDKGAMMVQMDQLKRLGVDLPTYEEMGALRGQIGAIANLTDCVKMTEESCSSVDEVERICGFWEPGRLALTLKEIYTLPVPIAIARGSQGRPIPVDAQVEEQIWHQLMTHYQYRASRGAGSKASSEAGPKGIGDSEQQLVLF